MKKYSVIGKWLLAGSLGIAAVSFGGPLPPPHVSAEQAVKQVDYEKAAKEFVSLAEQQNWESLYPLLSQHTAKALATRTITTALGWIHLTIWKNQ